MSELTRRPSSLRNETFYDDSHFKVETDVNNNGAKGSCSSGFLRKRDIFYVLLHVFTALALIHAYTHINSLSADNKETGLGF